MKKNKAFLITLFLSVGLTLAACGNAQSASAEANTEISEEAATEEDILLSASWVGLSSGSSLKFNADGTMSYNDHDGTWEENEDTSITVSYSTNQGSIEMTFDKIDNDGVVSLENRPNGKLNGSPCNYTQDVYFNNEQDISSASKVLGDTVSTNIFDFTLISAEPAIALDNNNDTDRIFMPKEYEASHDANNPFVAPKGSTIIALTFEITNTDRSGISIGCSIPGSETLEFDWKVQYNNELYYIKNSASQKSTSFELKPGNVLYNNSVREKTVTGKLLQPGETLQVRTFGYFDTDMEDLNDDLKVIIPLLNSKGESEIFVYDISKND